MSFELILAAMLVILYLAFCAWHSQGGGKLTRAETDQYITSIEKLPLPSKAVQVFIARLRLWAEAERRQASVHVQFDPLVPRVAAIYGRAGFHRDARTSQCTL